MRSTVIPVCPKSCGEKQLDADTPEWRPHQAHEPETANRPTVRAAVLRVGCGCWNSFPLLHVAHHEGTGACQPPPDCGFG